MTPAVVASGAHRCERRWWRESCQPSTDPTRTDCLPQFRKLPSYPLDNLNARVYTLYIEMRQADTKAAGADEAQSGRNGIGEADDHD